MFLQKDIFHLLIIFEKSDDLALLFYHDILLQIGNKNIRKTCPCNEYPLKPHCYIGKLGYAGVCLFFLFLLQNIDCGNSLEPPRRGGSNEYPQSMF